MTDSRKVREGLDRSNNELERDVVEPTQVRSSRTDTLRKKNKLDLRQSHLDNPVRVRRGKQDRIKPAPWPLLRRHRATTLQPTADAHDGAASTKPTGIAPQFPSPRDAIDECRARKEPYDQIPLSTGTAAAESCVRTDTAKPQIEDPSLAIDFQYTLTERAAIDVANAVFAPVIKAVDALENIEAWLPPLVKGLCALRTRAMRESGALNHFDQQYRKLFGILLNAERIGPWLLDRKRRSLLHALHYLGSEDGFLDSFMEWRAKSISKQRRERWRTVRILVEHFKKWQSSTVAKRERRKPTQKEIERIRAEGHRADTARLAEVEQARRELATKTIETTETLWTILLQVGPEKVVQTLREHGAKDYALAVRKLIERWLTEPTE